MSAIKKNKTKSHRFMEIDWRDDADHDSSRNPVVEASQAVDLSEDTANVADETFSLESEETYYIDDSFIVDETDEEPKASDSVVRKAAVSEVFDIVVEGSANAEPNMVADSSNATDTSVLPNLDGAPARVQIDQVFKFIAPYAAVIDNKISETSLLGRSLLAQANAVFNTAFLNLQAKLGYSDIYADAPSGEAEHLDITEYAIDEVMRLQRLS